MKCPIPLPYPDVLAQWKYSTFFLFPAVAWVTQCDKEGIIHQEAGSGYSVSKYSVTRSSNMMDGLVTSTYYQEWIIIPYIPRVQIKDSSMLPKNIFSEKALFVAFWLLSLCNYVLFLCRVCVKLFLYCCLGCFWHLFLSESRVYSLLAGVSVYCVFNCTIL